MWLSISVLSAAVGCLAYMLRSMCGICSRALRMVSGPSSGGPLLHTTAPSTPVRIGLLGAAKIAPWALLYPARHAPEYVSVVAVGARDPERAVALGRQWGVTRCGDYASVLADEQVEAVYIALINGLHFEWAAAALRANKHVLVEKPIASNRDEAAALASLAASRGLVLAEAFHWRHHPLADRIVQVLRSGEVGEPLSLEVTAGLPTPDSLLAAIGSRLGWAPPERRAKMDYALGGGNFMGQGSYTVHVARQLLGEEPLAVINASSREDIAGSRADVATEANLLFPRGVTARLSSSAVAIGFDIRIRGSKGSLSVTNYLFPFLYHSLTISPASSSRRVEKVYGGDESTFELQLRAFSKAVRKMAAFPLSPQDAVANMRWIDEIYTAAGLGARPSRTLRLDSSGVAS